MKFYDIIKIEPNNIHIWYIPLNNEELLDRFIHILSSDELQKANNFHFLRHRKAYLLRKIALRQILSKYCNIEAKHIQFKYTKNQKPYLRCNAFQLQFNITSSYNLALLAITTQTPIGVDVEHFRPIDDIMSVTKQFFSTVEISKFITLPTSKQLEAFYTIWTSKEAFVKAIGTGLLFPLQTLTVGFLPTDPLQLLEINNTNVENQKWFLQGFKFNYLHNTYISAIFIKSQKKKLICFDYPNQLVSV